MKVLKSKKKTSKNNLKKNIFFNRWFYRISNIKNTSNNLGNIND